MRDKNDVYNIQNPFIFDNIPKSFAFSLKFLLSGEQITAFKIAGQKRVKKEGWKVLEQLREAYAKTAKSCIRIVRLGFDIAANSGQQLPSLDTSFIRSKVQSMFTLLICCHLVPYFYYSSHFIAFLDRRARYVVAFQVLKKLDNARC